MKAEYAAVDLGSNSFHLVVARSVDGEIQIVDKLRERVRLAAGLDADCHLDPKTRAAAITCLETFGQRLSNVPNSHIRVCGTNTFRKMVNADEFMQHAQTALGQPIDIISGREEARLVYRGVSQDLEDDGARRLVIDIGGGSTECIIGRGQLIERADSLYMGCVEYSQRYFGDGRITHERVDQAVVASRLELGSLHRPFKRLGWDSVYGSSGTINAVQSVLAANGHGRHQIDRAGIEWILDRLISMGRVDDLSIPGLKAERAQVFVGGICILNAVFRSLAIESMVVSTSALREGVLYDLIGRTHQRDIRDDAVRRMQERYGVDLEQSERMESLLLDFAHQALPSWGLNTPENRQSLRWAARLYEIGKAINYTGYHRHGAYLIANSEMVGFSRQEQSRLAALVLGQRRKLIPQRIKEMVGDQVDRLMPLIVLLRLASRLNRTRNPKPKPQIGVSVDQRNIHISFPTHWIEERPLTSADLTLEATRLAQVGFNLRWHLDS